MDALELLEKYDVPVPRYTSYPTVPLWDSSGFSQNEWMLKVKEAFNGNKGISLYIHLPYCESLCTYCGCNKHITKNHLLEEPYIKGVLKEWFMYSRLFNQKPVISEIHLGGGTPTFFSPKNLRLLINGILENGVLDRHNELSFEAHPNGTTYEHLKMLRSLGFNRLSLGVQDFSPSIMRTINRVQTEEQVEQVTTWARELGFGGINYDLIYGLPGQNLDNIKYNLKKVAELKPDRIAFYSYAHVPNLAKGQRAYNEDDLPKGKEKMKLYELGKLGFQKMKYYHIGMDHFCLESDELTKSAKTGKLHRNFMGYTSAHTEISIGLGASAISDIWTGYAQNEKTTKEYLKRVNTENSPPVVKGHFLSKEDLNTRARLLSLICFFETNWFDQKEDFSFKIQQQLAEMEKDGLLKIFPHQIKVSEKGKSFIRNICAVLDKRMNKSPLNKPTFSKAV